MPMTGRTTVLTGASASASTPATATPATATTADLPTEVGDRVRSSPPPPKPPPSPSLSSPVCTVAPATTATGSTDCTTSTTDANPYTTAPATTPDCAPTPDPPKSPIEMSSTSPKPPPVHTPTSTSSTAPSTSALPPWASAIFRQAFSSTVGAAVTATVVTPLDVIKVRVQAHLCPAGCPSPCQHPSHVSGAIDAVRKILRTDGIRGLWRGLNVTLLLAIPTTGLYFTLYEALRTHLPFSDHLQHQHPWLTTATAGACSRLVSATAVSPLELARTNVQAGTDASVIQVLGDVRRKHGIRAWWRGLGPTLLRDAPFSAIYWSMYETLKTEKRSPFPKRMFRTGNEFQIYLASGIGAGSLAALCTIPADVIKTKRQTAVGTVTPISMSASKHLRTISGALPHSHNAPTTSLGVAREIIATEGYRGLFKGVGPRMAKIAPASAIMMGTFETVKRYIGDWD